MKTNNKGFTLVELIIVIVILAILIGVTIGGIYRYVGQARINTDINNANAVEEGLRAMGMTHKSAKIYNYYFVTTFDGYEDGKVIQKSHNYGSYNDATGEYTKKWCWWLY